MTNGDFDQNEVKDDGTLELSDSDLDNVVGAGPISDALYASSKIAGAVARKTSDLASSAAGKVKGAASDVAQDVSDSGDAILDGFNDGLGNGDNNNDST